MAQTVVHPLRMRTIPRSAAPANQAYQILHIGYAVLPIITGVDKFFHILTDWTGYLAPAIAQMSGQSPQTLMQGIGVVEILAGLLVAIKPSIGGYVVAVWLWAIIANLLILGSAYDVALRHFGLSLGAFALARLAIYHETSHSNA